MVPSDKEMLYLRGPADYVLSLRDDRSIADGGKKKIMSVNFHLL